MRTPITSLDLADVARRLNVARVVLVDPDGDSIAVRVVYADERGRLHSPEIRARPDVDVDFALAHVDAASVVSRLGAVVTAADEMDAEVEKHRAIFDRFRSAEAAAAARGDDVTAAKMHDLAMHIEGELMWWEGARAREELKVARGYIDAHDAHSVAHRRRARRDDAGSLRSSETLCRAQAAIFGAPSMDGVTLVRTDFTPEAWSSFHPEPLRKWRTAISRRPVRARLA